VLLLSRKKRQEVQRFLLKVVNNHCAELEALATGPRGERRVRLTMVVLVIPMIQGRPMLGKMFSAVTKEFSTSGVSLVVSDPRVLDEVILAFRWESDMKFVLAKAVHLNPMGAGFYHLGLKTTEILEVGDYPGLADVRF
jgi:hypothetical protein